MPDSKRNISICVLSDIHLGTHGCNAKQLLAYLKTIKPKLLILNGDIIDVWNFKKSFFPKSHMMIIRRFLKMMEQDTKIIYVTGNHDEVLRKYSDINLGNLSLVDKYLFTIDGKSHWVFHGDIFDHTTKGYTKILAKLGGEGYDLLVIINRLINNLLLFFGKDRVSLSRKVKNSVKTAVKWVSDFEKTASELAIEQGYDYVLCGHIHIPKIEKIANKKGSVTYLNSGDWIENFTALEYYDKDWHLYEHNGTIDKEVDIEPNSVYNEERMVTDLKTFIPEILNFNTYKNK